MCIRDRYISAYECDPATVADEFLLAKASYAAMTGREQKKENNVLCYQIRQSFYPGEITPKEANRIGYELAMRWTKGRHAFIVTTHTDKQHIHCHISVSYTHLGICLFFPGTESHLGKGSTHAGGSEPDGRNVPCAEKLPVGRGAEL